MAFDPESVVVGTPTNEERAVMCWRPESVNVLGVTYRVRRKKLPDGEDGYIVPRRQLIVLGRHLSEEKAEQVLLHEVVHGILDQLGYLDLYEDEHLVQGLAIGLHQALMRG